MTDKVTMCVCKLKFVLHSTLNDISVVVVVVDKNWNFHCSKDMVLSIPALLNPDINNSEHSKH